MTIQEELKKLNQDELNQIFCNLDVIRALLNPFESKSYAKLKLEGREFAGTIQMLYDVLDEYLTEIEKA